MHFLDNAIWNALTTRQSGFAEAFDEARRFPREVTSLTAFVEPNRRGYESLAALLGPRDAAVLSLDAPYQPLPGWDLVTTFPGLQMVCENGTATNGGCPSPEIVKLGQSDSPEMVELAKLTKPGPFGIRTYELGLYVGIRSAEGKLVAMAGERLKVPGYTEVSAVCTHPDHTGKGYARALMMEVMKGIHERGETAFLHVRQDNTRAVQVYQHLGYRTRKIVQFTVLRKL